MEKVPELNYRSFLANDMRDYLDYLDHLGFSILVPAYRLKPIDRFLAPKTTSPAYNSATAGFG